MRIRTYVDGRPAWSENQPSYARIPGHRGTLVSGESGPRELDRQRAAVRRQEEREERARAS